ncbi:MAG: electron transport complex subunit RsxC [Cellvibrionaceae bacterium]
MRKLWDIPGGIHPPEHKEQSLGRSLIDLPLPPIIVLPVSQHLGAPAEPIVAVGDKVLKGQLIASGNETISANVHASTSGIVIAIEERPLPHPSGMNGLCIVIEPDGADQWTELPSCNDYRQLEPPALLERIQAAGIAGMGGAGFPTAVKLGSPLKIETLIVNGTECEPYITADDMLMQTQATDIVRGIELLSFLLKEPREILIGIEDNKPRAIAAMESAVKEAGNEGMEVIALPTKYPSGGEKQLVQMLTGREIPSGKLPAQLGIVCQNVATVLAAYRAVRFGEPLFERITTVTGEAFTEQRNVKVRVGTPISFVLRAHGYDPKHASRLVMGGPMMGFSIINPEAPVIKTTNCLLAPSLQESPPPQPPQACIRCGLCAEACPASLLPQQLYWYARAEDQEKLKAHNLFDCIECGACSYVCPSHIPLVQFYRAAKGDIRRHDIDKKHSDRARKRFELHKERIEAEKAARAKAREEAQAKAKQRNREKAAPTAGKKAPPNDANDKASLVADAVAKAKQAPVTDQKAKLERKLLSANDRLSKLKQKLLETEHSPDQADAIRARIKEAELVSEAVRNQLAELPKDKAPVTPKALAVDAVKPEQAAEPSDALQNELQQQLVLTRKKLADIDPADHDGAAALQLAINVIVQKLENAKTQGPAGTSTATERASNIESDAITAAMARTLDKDKVQD